MKEDQKQEARPLCAPTGDDKVYTPAPLASLGVDHFRPQGRILEPFKGGGAFSDLMPGCDWCEIDEGRDFFETPALDLGQRYDWIVTNPPFSLLYWCIEHAFKVADNVVFLAPLNQTLGLKARGDLCALYGFGIREIVLVDTPPPPWPSSGFQLAFVHWERGGQDRTLRWTDKTGAIQYPGVKERLRQVRPMPKPKVPREKVNNHEGALVVGTGMPTGLLLDEFGSHVWSVFGGPPYQVGSSLYSKTWRDVDVRMIISDEEWEQWGFGHPHHCHSNEKWVAFCLAFSALGKAYTGLPIDFQIQQQTQANKQHLGYRNPIGLVPRRFKKDPPPCQE